MNVNLCDECEKKIPDPAEWWHVARKDDLRILIANSGPFDLCSLECLATWALKVLEARASR